MTQPAPQGQGGTQVPKPKRSHLIVITIVTFILTGITLMIMTPSGTPIWKTVFVGIFLLVGFFGGLFAILLNRLWSGLPWRYWWVTVTLFAFSIGVIIFDLVIFARRFLRIG